MIRAEANSALDAQSLQIGSVRLTERFVRSDPPSAADTLALRDAIDGALRGAGWNYRPDTMVGIAGIVTTICAVSAGIAGESLHAAHGRRVRLDEVRGVRELVGAKTIADRRNLTGIVEGREDVIFAGTMILERVMEYFHAREVIVSNQGVRWGLVWREIDSLSR